VQAVGRPPQRAPDATPIYYERHRPEQTTLYRLVQQHAVENLSVYVCPNCGHSERIFGADGGRKTAA